MRRTLFLVAAVVGIATPGSAVILTVFTTNSSNVPQSTFLVGDTILLKVHGEPQGASEYGIEGYLTWNGALTTTVSATQGNWLPDKGSLFAADGFSGIFNQSSEVAALATNPVDTSVITLVADAAGVVNVAFGGPVLDFFGIYEADPTSTAHSFTILAPGDPDPGDPTIEVTSVGNPGNAADTTGYGSVAYGYKISTHEITNAQYAYFLNSVADTDTNQLYNTSMGSGLGGIIQSGSSGSYSYSPIFARRDMPVNYVSWYDALRFANWVHNGKPNTGTQTSATTEDGAYTFSGPTTVGPRNAGAQAFLTNENEWYKAAYYDGASDIYFDYPAGTDTPTTCATPSATPNQANCDNAVADLTIAGSYIGSASPYGTFDQGGNIWEWNENIFFGDPQTRVLRGGQLALPASFLSKSTQSGTSPDSESDQFGFRLPEPASWMQLTAAVVALLALDRRRRRALDRRRRRA